jgi:uncharacterized protein (TIGR03086 family)
MGSLSARRRTVRPVTELPDLRPAARQFAALLRTIGDDELALPTPCNDYTVGALVDHVDKGSRGLATIAGAPLIGPDDTAAPADAAHLGGDWRQEVGEHAMALAAAWSDPRAWHGSAPVAPGVDLPTATWGRIALAELVVHGWDLARATGRPFTLPDDVLQCCLDHLLAFVPTAPVPDIWGEPIPVPPDAPLSDRVAAAAGRRP